MFLSGAKISIINQAKCNELFAGQLPRAPENGEKIGDLLLLAGYGDGTEEAKLLIDTTGRGIASGALNVELPAFSKILPILLKGGETAERMCSANPQWWNTFAYEMEWKTYPEYNDFLDPSSPVFHRKSFQWEIYRNLLDRELGELPDGARALDAGGGIGRSALPLLKKGFNVTIADASHTALTTAWKHLSAAGAGGYDLAWADSCELNFIPDDSHHAAIALELICYQTNPLKGLREIVRCVKPGGWVAFSVENRLGAMLADPRMTKNLYPDVLLNKKAVVKEDLFVRYFDRADATAIADEAGLSDIHVKGCHYIADGIFGKSIPEKRYADDAARKRMSSIEQLVSGLPGASSLGRAWLVTGRVK